MTEIVLSVASKVAQYLVAPVGRQCGYVIFTDSCVDKLEKELNALENMIVGVQNSINDADNNMRKIRGEVNGWKNNAETLAKKAHDMLENDGRDKKTCFWGCLPDPKERYCFGRDATKTIEAIQALISEGKFERVYYEGAPPGRVPGSSDVNLLAGKGGDTITDSRASIFQDIVKALDDEKQKVIGVYGPGGVGKTTLLEEVEKKLKKEGRPFHMIVKAKVSQTQDLNKIQDDIAYFFGLKLKDQPSEEGRRDLLCQRLQKDPSEKILIILDDLWDKLDLKAVGIPFGDERRGCKLLLTSRFRDVLEQKMLADLTFRLEGLNNDEAFKLFEKTVGDKLKDEELRQIAPEVVKKLAGLPLLIISVASTLKYSHMSAWKKALRKIDESNIETIVKLSYDHLKSEDTKSLFLLCGLIGGTIQVETLFVLGMGLGLFEEFNKTMQDSRDELNTALDSLRSICLLQDGSDGKGIVTIHDLYSEVVVSIPFRGLNSLMMNSNYGSWQKEKLEKCCAICLADVGRDRLAELMMCQFPNLKILMLSQPEDWRWMREHQHDVNELCGLLDFIYMKELRVLYLRSMLISSFSSSIGILGNLHSLFLDHCDVEDVTILGKLKALQILSFAQSAISRLPKEIGELTNLRSLNLSNCYRLETIEPGVLEGLIKLEELQMKSSFDQWMGTDEIPSESCNARLAELKSVTRLTTLEISIPNPTILLENGDLPFGNLIKFWINIGNVDGREFQGLRTMKLKLEGCDSILSKDWVQETLQKTQYLHLDGLGEFKKNAHELCVRGFTQLKHLDIQNSPSIKYIASSSSDLPPAFPMLESLFLENLEKLCNGPIAPDCFSKLKDMSIRKCHRLENMWFQSKMQRLIHLEEIQICECDSLQAIITYDAGKVEATADDIVELPNVRHLELRKLSNMTSFCTRAKGAPIQVSLPRLESLVMVGLLGLEKILYSEPSFKYNNLKSLKIEESKSMSIILKDWILKLPNLESMVIAHTPFVEVVFDLEELKVIEEVEILSRLSILALSELPNLRHMWKQDVQLQGISILRNLKELSINNTRLSFLFPFSGTDGILELPLLERLSISCCPTEKFFSYPHGEKESIVTTSDSKDTYSDSFFDQKVSLPSLQELLLKSVGSLKRIWHGVLPKSSFDKLANLTLSRCSDLLDVFPSTIIGRLHNLKSLKVLKCPSLESLFDFGSLDSYTEQTIVLLPKLKEVMVKSCRSLESLFSCGSLDSNMEHKSVLLPKLKIVAVREAGRLRHIVLSDSHTDFSLPNLKIVMVDNCSELRYLFPYYTATTLNKLKLLAIINCKQMKEVVPKEEGGRSKAKVMSFPSLITLIIWWCPNLGAFVRSPTSAERQLGEMIEENDESAKPLFNDMVTFPNMRGLGIKGVQCKELWNDQIPDDSLCNLKSLKFKGCDNLQRIAPSHMWKRLQRCLKTLEVKSCRLIKIIYESDGTVAESGNLMRLVLCDLDNLRHIWQYDSLSNIPFPSLRYVKAIRCSRLEMLFATSTVKFLEQIKELVVGSCEDMELIAGHEECEEATGTTITFSKLNTLRLWNLPKFRSFLPENYSMKFPSWDKSDQSSESQDESDESDGKSQDESDSEIELSDIESCLESSEYEREEESEDEEVIEERELSESEDSVESSESESEEEKEDEELMGKLRTKVIGEREFSESEDSVESEEIVSVGEGEGNIEFYEG